MIKNIPALLGALCLVGTASGNGGGFRFGVEFTGGVAPFEPSGTDRVQIVDEKLDIVLHRADAEVRVRYVMENVTRRKARVTFGFPIEVTKPWTYGKKKPVSAKVIAQRAEKSCRDYSVYADGERVSHERTIEPFALGKLNRFPGSKLIKGIGAWNVSTLTFAPGQRRSIEIRYGADHDEKGTTTSNDRSCMPPVFRYRLSTGGVWAGPIAEGRVRVTLGEADSKWLEFKKPAGRFKRDGDAWVWNFTNLEPTLADDIEIVTGPPREMYSARGNSGSYYVQTDPEFRKNKKRGVPYHSGWQYLNKTYEAVASSTLPDEKQFTYGAKNLKNWDFVSEDKANRPNSYAVWCEGVEGHGIGESLTLTVSKPLPIQSIRIHPGHGRSEVLFNANSRPSKIKVTLNGEHQFEAKLRDVNRDQFVPVTGYSKPVEEVRIEIAEVYPGWEFTDTCISDVALISPLDKEPKRYGAR